MNKRYSEWFIIRLKLKTSSYTDEMCFKSETYFIVLNNIAGAHHEHSSLFLWRIILSDYQISITFLFSFKFSHTVQPVSYLENAVHAIDNICYEFSRLVKSVIGK